MNSQTVFLHGLGQTARDWDAVIRQASLQNVDCPELFMLSDGELLYPGLLRGLEKRFFLYARKVFPEKRRKKRDLIRLSHSMRSLNY